MDARASLLGTPREWAKDLTAATAIGTFLGVIGPYGTFEGGPLEVRLPFWIVNFWLGFIFLSLTVRLAIKGATRFGVPVWFALAAAVAVGAAPLGYILAMFSQLFWPGAHGHMRPFFDWYAQTVVIAEPSAFGYHYLGRRGWRGQPKSATKPEARRDEAPDIEQGLAPQVRQRLARDDHDPVPSASAPHAPRLMGRLPPRLGGELLCLQMEDHYVRAHTTRGSDLILMSLRQALEELGDDAGMQVHRSWWVRRNAVEAQVTVGRRLFLRLVNGLEVPVSRTAVARLRAAGWISETPGRNQTIAAADAES